jgi:hypothetical protein
VRSLRAKSIGFVSGSFVAPLRGKIDKSDTVAAKSGAKGH